MWQDSALPQTLHVGHRGEAGYWMSFANRGCNGINISQYCTAVVGGTVVQRLNTVASQQEGCVLDSHPGLGAIVGSVRVLRLPPTV